MWTKSFLKAIVAALLLNANITYSINAKAEEKTQVKSDALQSQTIQSKRGKKMLWFEGARNDIYTWYGLQDIKDQEKLNSLYQAYLDSRSGIGAQSFGKALPAGHVLTQFVQKILDWGDESARALYKAETGQDLVAPHPIAKVIPSSNLFNAFASGAPICTDLEFGENAKSKVGVLLNPKDVMEVPLKTSSGLKSCLPRPSNWTNTGIIDFWQNSEHPPKCILTLRQEVGKKAKVIVEDQFKSACAGTQGWGEETGAGGEEAIIGATSQFIHISTDIFYRVGDFRTLLYILAHELGHYYLGHNTDIGAARYNYIYSRVNLKYGVPKRNDALTRKKEYIKEAYLIQQAQNKNIWAPDVNPKRKEYSDRLNKFLILGVGAVLKQAATQDQPQNQTSRLTEKCQAVVSQIPSNYIVKKMTGGFLELVDANLQDSRAIFKNQLKKNEVAAEWATGVIDGKPTADHLTDLLEYKNRLAACAPEFSIKAGETVFDSVQMYSLMRRHFSGHAPLKDSYFTDQTTLKDFLTWADSEAKVTDEFISKLLPAIKKNIGGFYTAEQAADEFALKIATMGGMTPKQVIEGVLKFGQTAEGVYNDGFGPGTSDKVHQKNMDLSFAECTAAYEKSLQEDKVADSANGFNVKDGKFVGMGNLADKHHSDCYRVYNLWRLTQIDPNVEKANNGEIKDQRLLAITPVEPILSVNKNRYDSQLKPLEDQFSAMLAQAKELTEKDSKNLGDGF